MFSQIQNTISESLTKYTNIILTRSAHATRWFQKCSSSLMVQIIAPYVQTPQFISRISDTSVKVRFSMSIKTNTTNTISFTSQSDLTTSRPIDKPLQSLYTSHNIPVNQHDIRIPSAKIVISLRVTVTLIVVYVRIQSSASYMSSLKLDFSSSSIIFHDCSSSVNFSSSFGNYTVN